MLCFHCTHSENINLKVGNAFNVEIMGEVFVAVWRVETQADNPGVN